MYTSTNRITLNIDTDAEVSVRAFIAPIEYTQYNFHVEWEELANLRAAEPEKQYPNSIFCDFLPKEPISIGTPWEIEQAGAWELLKQFNPNPMLSMCAELQYRKTESQGLWACLRTFNDEFADIVFRIHAQFALKDGWLTPSQFTGHLVIDRMKKSVSCFQMYVPEGTINFDAKWKINPDEEGHITDSGFCPQMELQSGNDYDTNRIEFTESISIEEAKNKLIRRFYKSQQINWVSLGEALEMAPAHKKPIHVISIDGPLFDESC